MEDNSVLLEDSNMEEVVAPRKSMSQPSLAVQDVLPESTETTPKHGMNSAYSASNVRSIPIIQTWHENDQLKGQMYSLRCEVQMYERKYLEAKEACHKSVQEVLDDYVNLKVAQDDMEEKSRLFAVMQKDLYDAQEKLDASKDLFECQAVEFEKQRHAMEQKIHELESALADTNNTTMGSFRGTLDDILKRGDPNYTLTNDEDRKIQDLEAKLVSEQERVACLEELVENLRQEIDDQSARLAGSENARVQLEAAAGQGILGAAGAAIPNATFVIGNARESQTEAQIKYIDELEKQLTEAKNEYERARLALVEYMNKCSKLENDIHTMRKNTTFDSSSILVAGKTSEELKAQIDKVNGELNTLRAENRELRIRCDQLTGGEGNVSISLGESRLMAGISANNLDSSVPNETGGTSMRILPRESQLDDLQESQILQDSQLPLMDTTAAKKNSEEFDALWAEFESEQHRLKDMPNDTVESSFNSSMPPPDRDATQSFLSQKGFKNSPLTAQKSQSLQHQLHARQISIGAEQIQNNSFSSKATSAMIATPSIPILQDVQQILDSSAILLEGQHDAAVNVEKMQAKMTQIRDALSRLFERLKSSAALFEDILEKMGSSSPLADRIKQMKLAFETSMCDHADVSNFLDAAEKDLTNMSLNFSVLEKSIVSQSFVADISRRFTIAPGAEDVASSSLLNTSYSPIFKFSDNQLKQSTEVDQLKKELADLKTELEKARARELRSPLQSSPNRLSDVQIKAAQNFEELEVCQATLKKVDGEKAALAQEISELDATNHVLLNNISELKQDLDKALDRLNVEHHERQKVETTLGETNRMLNVLKKEANEQSNEIMVEMEKRIVETREQVEAEHQALIESLKKELNISLSEENKIRDYMEEMKVDMERLRRRTTEAEVKVESAANERQQFIEQIVDLENKLEKLSDFEKETTDCAAKVASRKKELELARQREDVEKEVLEGLERIRKEMSELTKKSMKTVIIKGNATSIRMAFEELCRRISQEKARQHEYAQTMSMVNDKIEQLSLDAAARKSASPVEKENAPPVSAVAASSQQVGTVSQKSSTHKFICPTRQLLHESTMAVDAIVQKLKKTQFMTGMGPELKETVANLISDSRTLRDFLHQKLNLFKGIDMSNWKNETVDQLLERMERCYQDIAILEEENRKFKKEIKKMKATIPNLGADVQERIKREIGGIAHDMKALKDLREK